MRFILALLLCLNTTWVSAQDFKSTSPLPAGDVVVKDKTKDTVDHPNVQTVVIDGETWVAFNRDAAYSLLKLRMYYPKMQLKLEVSDELLHVRAQEIAFLDKSVSNLTQQLSLQADQLVVLQEELAAEQKWYKSGWLWAGVGVVTGILTTIAVAYAVGGV